MLRNMFGRAVYMDVADDDGGGGGSGAAGDPPLKTFTQAEVDQMIKRRVAKMSQQLTELQQKTEQMSALEAKLADLESSVTRQPEAKTQSGELEIKLQRLERSLIEQTKALESEKAMRLQAERDKSLSERDAHLKAVIAEAGGRDVTACFRFLAPDLVEEDGEWFLRTSTGSTAPINKEVVTEQLPDFMRVPAIKSGGSGSAPGSAKVKAKNADLERATKELEDLQKRVSSSGADSHLLAQYALKRKQVASLREEISKL